MSIPYQAEQAVAITAVIPAFNEKARLGETLSLVWRYLQQRFPSFEIIVVDDGSGDGTSAVVEHFAREHVGVRLIAYSPNQGKGCAVRTGVLESRGALVLFSDADLSTPIEELEKLMAALDKGADVAVASRAMAKSELVVRQPRYRELGGRALNKIVQMAAVPGIRDTQCGFKLFRREAALSIFERCSEDGFSFDIEALYLARRLGRRVVEVPVRWMHRDGSKVRVLKEAGAVLCAIQRIRRRHRGVSGGRT